MGSHLVELLIEYDADVFAFIRAASSGALHHLYPSQKKITILRGDLSDKTAVMDAPSAVSDATLKELGLKLT